jgi:diaminopimelate dehydrogenase
MSKIRAAIVGYGNIGKGVEAALSQNPDFELKAVFTRREPDTLTLKTPGARVLREQDAHLYKDEIDVIALCGGSNDDLPTQGPKMAALFNMVDSFDTHAAIPGYLAKMDAAARQAGRTAIISTGWDPGLFSMLRLLSGAVLPVGEDYTFWGKGVSQGHSSAVRSLPGVKDAVQYTIPVEAALQAVRAGEQPNLTTREKHIRVCYVVPEEGADTARIEQDIKTMKNYFDAYDTTVHFITQEQMRQDHAAMPHGGFVFRSGVTGGGHRQIVEFSLKLASNPEFTAGVMVAFMRAAYRLNKEGQTGGRTVFDIPLYYLSAAERDSLIKELL